MIGFEFSDERTFRGGAHPLRSVETGRKRKNSIPVGTRFCGANGGGDGPAKFHRRCFIAWSEADQHEPLGFEVWRTVKHDVVVRLAGKLATLVNFGKPAIRERVQRM